jgi:microcystin-dependent protein
MNGAAISRTRYSKLWTLFSNSFGDGDGSSTFNVPDTRGLFPRFWSDGSSYDVGRLVSTKAADHAITVGAYGSFSLNGLMKYQ